LLAAWTSQNWHWIVGAVLILSNVPYTLFGIMPINHRLEAILEADAGPNSRATLVLWGQLHDNLVWVHNKKDKEGEGDQNEEDDDNK
jgi:hypothetical protein